jgi:hypothetical protein
MRGVSPLTVGLGVLTLLVASAVPAEAQRLGDPSTANSRSEPTVGVTTRTDVRGGRGRAAIPNRAVPTNATTLASPAARPSDPNPSAAAAAAVGASPAHTNAAAPASIPSRLSSNAPSTAPALGVVGGGAKSPGVSATPEPTTLLLMGAGLAGLYGVRRRMR